MRQIILGTDEAGYGPNLGPLVVSLTAWEAPSGDLSCLFEPLKNEGIHIGDSKKLYHGGSLVALETGVLVPLQHLVSTASKGMEYSMFVSCLSQRHKVHKGVELPDTPWCPSCLCAKEKHRLERNVLEEQIDSLTKKFAAVLQQHQIQLLDMQYRSVEPEEFNQLIDRFHSKGTLLSHITLRLITDQLAKLVRDGNDLPVLILCDKHGGRNHYLDILTEFFPGEFIQTIQQSRERSVYRLTSEGQLLEFQFLAKGESQFPIALASMLSKYQRELAMERFNAFWQSHVPDLQPTAGYPEDAKRFKEQIADAQEKLAIPDAKLWRKR